MGIQINGQNDEIRAVDGSGTVHLDVEGNITGNVVSNLTGNATGITTTQITVGDTFIKSTSFLFDENVSFLDLSSNIFFSGAKLVFAKIFFISEIILPLGIAIIIFDIIFGFYI